MKKYAVAIDTSPSEQIGEDDDSVFCMGFLFGLKSPHSFDMVGDKFPNVEERLRLRKYSGSSAKYKKSLVTHLTAIKRSDQLVAGISIVNQRFIKRVGLPVWIKAYGELPPPSSFSKKNKPRFMLGGYEVDGQIRPPFEVLADELAILGWLALEFGLVHKMLCETAGTIVKLDIIIDRLPTDQGLDGLNKGEILKAMLLKMSDGIISIAGVPDISDTHQRDLLVDNIAGLGREVLGGNCNFMKPDDLNRVIDFTKINLP